jgi:hypothetical protein
MTKIVRLTESDLVNLVKKVMNEQVPSNPLEAIDMIFNGTGTSDVKFKELCKKCYTSWGNRTSQRGNQLADVIRDAVQGAGTDEQEIFSVFKSLRSVDEFCSLVKSYASSYSTELYNELKSDLNGEGEWVIVLRFVRNLFEKEKSTGVSKPSKQLPTQKPMVPTKQVGRNI